MASIIGNIIEWYDFSLYLYLAPVIAQVFFPQENKVISLILTFLVFAMGFILRPVGSILFGHLGDSIGRAKTLKLTILLTAISAISIAFLPTYHMAGIGAPISLILLRVMQGLCISGEFAGSMVYLTESAPSKKRALVSCMTNNGSNFGIILATGIAALLATFMPVSMFNTYGWRILFLVGGIVGLFGFWLRNDIQESDVFKKIQTQAANKKPLLTLFLLQKRRVLDVFLLLVMSASGSYVLMGYLTTYLHVYLHYSMAKALQLQTLFNVVSIFAVTLFSVISDSYGRRFTLYIAAVGYIILSIPCFYYLQITGFWLCLLPLVLVYSAEQSTTPVAMVEMFPGATRYSGVSIGYNLAMAIIGGTAPLINTWLITIFNNTLMIAYYLIACAIVSLLVVIFRLPKTFGHELELS